MECQRNYNCYPIPQTAPQTVPPQVDLVFWENWIPQNRNPQNTKLGEGEEEMGKEKEKERGKKKRTTSSSS
jgi:hypothetical protein